MALIDNTVCDLNKNTKVYLWVKKAENQIISAKEINLETAVKKSQIEEVENTTKRIKTENDQIREVTLITCTQGNKERLILKAKEIK